MGRAVLLILVSSLVLASCGRVAESRFNPFNWFGRSVSEPVASDGSVNPLIPRRRASIFRQQQDEAYAGTRVAEITELLVERRPGGAVIRATAIASRQGPFDVQLTPVEDEDAATLTYSFDALQVAGPRGGAASRTVTAGVWLTDNDLAGVRTIRVLGTANARSARR